MAVKRNWLNGFWQQSGHNKSVHSDLEVLWDTVIQIQTSFQRKENLKRLWKFCSLENMCWTLFVCLKMVISLWPLWLTKSKQWACGGSSDYSVGHPNTTPTFSEWLPLCWVELNLAFLRLTSFWYGGITQHLCKVLLSICMRFLTLCWNYETLHISLSKCF